MARPFSAKHSKRRNPRPANDPATLDAAPLAPRPRPCTFAFQRASKRAEPRATQQTPWW
uniref:Uncharacterized protein n=1 Tax=Caenorhabditis japonica TaxID=281687 RepID=A0A8R1HM10_CAEJA